uniref:RE1-silencing transcription factor n=1 Tax=Cacopsylla melanoneura TaxID=428564 RepID=A0A8D8T909_9HEMI
MLSALTLMDYPPNNLNKLLVEHHLVLPISDSLSLSLVQSSASRFIVNDKFDTLQACIHCRLFETIELKKLLAHCKSCPFMQRPLDDPKQKFMCYACPYLTTDSGHMKRHIMGHTGLKPYTCQYCSYSSNQHVHLKRHLKRHFNDHFLFVDCD